MILNDERNIDREIFNVGSDTMNFSIKEIAEIIGDRLKLDTITFGQHDADQRSYELDFSKLNEYFPSYNIEFNLQKGIDDLIYNFEKYEINGSEKRISVLNKLISEKKLTRIYFGHKLRSPRQIKKISCLSVVFNDILFLVPT